MVRRLTLDKEFAACIGSRIEVHEPHELQALAADVLERFNADTVWVGGKSWPRARYWFWAPERPDWI